MAAKYISRQNFFDLLCESACISDINLLVKITINKVIQHYELDNIPQDIESTITESICNFLKNLRQRWKTSRYDFSKFTTKNSDWPQHNLFADEFDTLLKQSQPSTSTSHGNNWGHPSKDWDSLSTRSKKRKAQELLTRKEPRELLFAASQGSYKKDPNLKYVLEFISHSPSRSEQMHKKTHLQTRQVTQVIYEWWGFLAPH